MEEAGTLENLNLLSLVLPDFEPGQRPRPRIDTSSLSSTSHTAFSKMPIVTIFPGQHRAHIIFSIRAFKARPSTK